MQLICRDADLRFERFDIFIGEPLVSNASGLVLEDAVLSLDDVVPVLREAFALVPLHLTLLHKIVEYGMNKIHVILTETSLEI